MKKHFIKLAKPDKEDKTETDATETGVDNDGGDTAESPGGNSWEGGGDTKTEGGWGDGGKTWNPDGDQGENKEEDAPSGGEDGSGGW